MKIAAPKIKFRAGLGRNDGLGVNSNPALSIRRYLC